MAFSYTILERVVFGSFKVAFGTFTQTTGDTGGDIDTQMNSVKFFSVQSTGSATTSQPSVNESFPTSSGTITIVTADADNGIWFAIGK